MWLIEDEEKRFTADKKEIEDVATTLQQAQSKSELTLVVGNGVSQSAAWLHDVRKQKREPAQGAPPDISWEAVVKRAAKESGVPLELVASKPNNLALAQAVIVAGEKAGKDIIRVRHDLLSNLNRAFNQDIEPTSIDKMLVALAPRDIVTTNYDFQLERAFHRLSDERWTAFVRHVETHPADNGSTSIHKMHGSFNPQEGTLGKTPLRNVIQNYRFAESFRENHAEASIVITESDYDDCYQEVGKANSEDSALMLALSRTCLIIGKSLDAQDLSFMFALRKTRSARRRNGQHAFMLFNEPLTPSDNLNLYNLDIRPLLVNLPRARTSGHYYFGVAAALARLFPTLRGLFEEAMKDPQAGFAGLVRGPDVIAIGLASRNITGQTTYHGQNILPPPGRRNLRYTDVEEHVGGSAMTPLMILSALDKQKKHRLSMVSAIGKEADTYRDEILRFCKEREIDADAVSCNQDNTWHSTVLVHTSELADHSPYSGQRVFLDQGYNGPVRLEFHETEQLQAQLMQSDLRLLYLDKFMAAQHPPLFRESDFNEKLLGPLLQPENLNVLKTTIVNRPTIDIVYETGGGGSPFQHVEERLAGYVNIFTAGFPFFAGVVLHKLKWDLPTSLKVFDPAEKWWEADFSQEAEAANAMVWKLVDKLPTAPGDRRVWPCKVPSELLQEAERWAGRAAATGRRWFIVTLHHLGAFGIDLVNKVGWYCRTPAIVGDQIKNTSGAGDSFRAGLMYALLSSTHSGSDALAHALSFSTDVATERCHHFSIKDACKSIEDKFGGRYSIYESMPLG
jgi:hypothetical protein